MIRCDISAELKFIASHFYDFLYRPDALKSIPFSVLYETIDQGSLRLENEDSLYNFISRGIETNRETHGLLEFVRLEYCSTEIMNDFLDIFSDYFYEINASKWTNIRGRLISANVNRKPAKQFPPLVKKGKYFDGIIAHLTRECGGNVHDRHIVDVTSGSFEKEIVGANPHSGAYDNDPDYAAKNAADFETDSCFGSAFRNSSEDIPHTRNNWICYDFKERRIVPTHYTIRTHCYSGPGSEHLKSWLVETSTDGENWREVAREENNKQLNGSRFTATFAVAGGGEYRFIRLVNIGRNHLETDALLISAWEIFGNLIE
jgi:hypothetical protein